MIARDIRPGMSWSGVPVADIEHGFYGGFVFFDEWGRVIAAPGYDDADPATSSERPGKMVGTQEVPGDADTPPGPADTDGGCRR